MNHQLVIVSDGKCREALYKDGHLVAQGARILAEDIARTVSLQIEYKEADLNYQPIPGFPQLLDDIYLFV